MTEKTDEIKDISNEDIVEALNQRDAAIVLAVADGLKKRWEWLLTQISRGKQRNNKYTQGYLECLRDTHNDLVDAINKALPKPEETTTEQGKEEA